MLDSFLEFDHDMITRYNCSGPRYTSYPTAASFSEQFELATYENACRRGNNDLVPASLSLYFHIPFCNTVCFYCACNKIVTKHKSRAKPYLDALEQEIEMVSQKFAGDREVEQLHFGGGTPTFLSEEEISRVMWKVKSCFNARASKDKDYSIELDPRSVTPRYIALLASLGFNRYSLGVQDIDPKVQKAVNRVQSVALTTEILQACREEGAKSINIDLIYGLPLQTARSFRQTVEKVIDMEPDRLSVFNYAHLPEMFKPQRRILESDLPDPLVKLEILKTTIEQLSDAGYVYIGMDHFAKPDDVLVIARETGTLHRNFQGYTTHGNCDLVAMGVSSISKIRGVFSQNYKDEENYVAALSRGELPIVRGYKTSAEDALRETIIQRLSCYGELEIEVLENKFKLDFKDHFKIALDALEPMAEDGLISITPDKILVLPKGRLLLRNICMAFDEYSQCELPTRFSKVI